MKFIYKIKFVFILAIFFSCDGLPDLNIDPNKSPSARPQEVLTSSIGYLAWVVDGRYNDLNCLWGQYWTWGPGVSLGNDARYVAEPDDHDNLWSRAYANGLADMNFLSKNEDPAFSGVAKILMAYTYQGLVDHFGDIPFSEALNGEIVDGSILSPNYDSAASVYDGIITLLDEGLASLALADGDEIGAEDLIYAGNLNNWIKFANSLKLRVYMRRSGVADDSDAVKAIISSGNLIRSADDVAEIQFAGIAGDENPQFASFEAGIGNFYVASNTSLNKLDELGDPRKEALYDPAINGGGIIGVDQGDIAEQGFTVVREDYSQGSAATYGPGVSTILMSDWEVWFLRAEAAAKYGTSDDEAAAFGNGVTASFDKLAVAGAADYIASLNYSAAGSMNNRMTQIGTQKWIACNGFQEDEGWIEARRFNLQEAFFQTPTKSALGAGIHPSIFLYPEEEQLLNANAPSQRSLTEKVFWDNL